jgi:serine/threonine protein kinase
MKPLSSMETVRLCPACKKPLPPDAPSGLCPECLMKQAFATATGGPVPNAGQPPAIEIIAHAFPNLEILELLGAGGMGAVYKARQKHLDRFVALKIMLPEMAKDAGFAERFTREARTLAKLNHPNLVTIHDFGESNGLFYFIMEFVDGVNLRQLIRDKTLTPEQALALVPKICDALQFAHDAGVMHRDIKPDNILVDKTGRVKIADFGLAKISGHVQGDVTLTGTGMKLGTLRYMAPEQLEDSGATVDHRADIYALGVVFYEMLTGELPLGRFALPSQKVQVDVRLDEIVLHALEKEPARRYQHASEIKTDVENVTGKSLPRAVVAKEKTAKDAAPDPAEPLPRHFYNSPSSSENAKPVNSINRLEAWWLSRSRGKQRLMSIMLGIVFLLSMVAFLTFEAKSTTTWENSSGAFRDLRDVTVGLGDPWYYFLHHKTGTRGGFESGLNLVSGSAMFGWAALCVGGALIALVRERKRRRMLADASGDTPQRKFFWSAAAGVAFFIAGLVCLVVHDVRKQDERELLSNVWQSVNSDFAAPGITSRILKKAVADELGLTPEQLEKVNAAANRAYLEFLKLENEHSDHHIENGHLVKTTRPFPDRCFALAQKLFAELRDIAGKPVIDEPERNAVWKLNFFRHAGEFTVRAELWEKDGKFFREEAWERDGKQVLQGKTGDAYNDDAAWVFGHYIMDWEVQKDLVHGSRPNDKTDSYSMGDDVLLFTINRVRIREIAKLLAADPEAVIKAPDPHAALVTQVGTQIGHSIAETQLRLLGIAFAKDATSEELLTKLEKLYGKVED